MMSDDSGSSSEEEESLQKVVVVVEPEVKKKRPYVRKPQSDEAKKVLVDRLAKARESKRVIGLERKKAAEIPPPPPPPEVKPSAVKEPVVKVKRERKAKPIAIPVRPMYEFI